MPSNLATLDADVSIARPRPVKWWDAGTSVWAQFPDWANFFLELGFAVGISPEGPTRAVVAITTPTRAFAAALCATGVVLGRCETQIAPDPEAHFAYLRTLPLGTPVSFRADTNGGRIGAGTLSGFETRDGVDHVVIRVSKQETRLVPSWNALRVQPDSDAPPSPSGRGSRLKRVNLAAGLMSGLLEPERVAAFLGGSRLECVVVSNRRLLREEIVETPFAITTEAGDRIEGHLQDVARVRPFLRNSDSYRSDVVSVTAKVQPARLVLSPAVAIFDGSRSFLRWSASYPRADWIIVLDRADRRLSDAIQMVDTLYATRFSDQCPVTVKSIPIGIECAVFDARRGAA